MSTTSSELSAVCKLADQLCGIQWDESKQYLIESRLKPLLAQFDCQNYEQLVRKAAAISQVRNAFVDAITTRETLFFRDESMYQALEHKIIPEVIDRRSTAINPRKLRIWSAACSSGQEPYSIAMLLMRMLPNIHQWDVQILATDISDAAIAQASRGIYSTFETNRGLSDTFRNRYFKPRDSNWQICDEVRSLISFKKINLLQPFLGMGPFDVILCRNVAIYFDLPVKRDLFERLAKVLAHDGALIVGSSESLASFGERWKPLKHCRSVFYQPNMPPASFTQAATQRHVRAGLVTS